MEQNKGFLAFPWGGHCGACGPHADSEEISFQKGSAANKENMLELRPVLRSQLRDCEQTLLERDNELRQLRHELSLLRCEKDAAVQSDRDALLNPKIGAKEALVKRYAASFSFVDGSQLQNTFLVWKHHVYQRTMRSKMLKQTCLSLSSNSSQRQLLVFSSWHSLVSEKKQAQIVAKKRRQQAVAQSATAKFLMQSDSALLRAIVIQWWRCSKESALQKRIEAVQAEKRAAQKASAAAPMAPGTEHKACCTLM